MTTKQSWIYQGRQLHGRFGNGTSPHDDADATKDQADDLFRPENAAQRVDYAAHGIIMHVPRDERGRWNGAGEGPFGTT